MFLYAEAETFEFGVLALRNQFLHYASGCVFVRADDDGNISRYAAIFTDITERKKTEERIKNLAYFDVLTGLPNRRLFNDRLTQSVSNANRQDAPMALIVMDLDMFKRINKFRPTIGIA